MESAKLKDIRLLLLDVDGVLTDGGIIYDDMGAETKLFNVKDGLGIRLLMDAGVRVCIVTGRRSKALHHRCQDLGISDIFEGVGDKARMLDAIVKKTGVAPEHVAAMGDDLPDLPLLRRVGVAIAVADAAEPVRRTAHLVTDAAGGRGAVREISEAILKAKQMWDDVLQRFRS
jgi:3-deoxy-D-manno-octulosonate 8-phosphate phosphatase (KDO 8-P phosphatase)